MGNKGKRGAMGGILLALLIILAQPFYPTKGLIPELAAFLTSVPLWIAAVLFPGHVTPLVEGSVVFVYFVILSMLIGVAFERKPIWGWLFVIAVALNHYVVYEHSSRKMGEVVQAVLNYFG